MSKNVGTVKGGVIRAKGVVRGGPISRNTGGTRDYELLVNKPSINGTELVGNYDEIDPTVPEWAKQETKPTYTYDEVGAVGAENELHISEIDRMFAAVFGE